MVRIFDAGVPQLRAAMTNLVDWPSLSEPDWMENDLLRMKLRAFAAGYQELAGNTGLWVVAVL